MEDETVMGMTNQRRYYDDTDYSVDPKLKNIDPVNEEPVKEVSLDDDVPDNSQEEQDPLDKLTGNDL